MLIATPDGRALQVLDAGGHGLPCLFHHGTPGGPVPWPDAVQAAADAGLRWVAYARPGYAASSPLPGRTVAQAGQDVATVLDHLGVQEFVTYGFSGGGPHALACAALLPDRCLAAASVAGLGPDGADDLDLLAGMGEDNVEELALARAGRSVLTPYLTRHADALRDVTGADLAGELRGLLSEADAQALTAEVAEVLAAGMREGLRVEVDGWLDDDLALVRPWGFDVAEIGVPVAVWQGGQDRMVPFHHGQWLVAHVPQAWGHLLPDDGHISVLRRLPEVLANLRELADRP